MRCLLIALVALSCAHTSALPPGLLDADGLPRLYCVDRNCSIYRSAQPDAKQFQTLRSKYGLRSDIKLNFSLEARDYVPFGIEMFEHAILPAGPVSHEVIAWALADLETSPKPVLVHCEQGVDRTGLIIALYRVRHGIAPAIAFREWITYGSHRLLLLEKAFFRETAWEPR